MMLRSELWQDGCHLLSTSGSVITFANILTPLPFVCPESELEQAEMASLGPMSF